jgi:hypothetical protein
MMPPTRARCELLRTPYRRSSQNFLEKWSEKPLSGLWSMGFGSATLQEQVLSVRIASVSAKRASEHPYDAVPGDEPGRPAEWSVLSEPPTLDVEPLAESGFGPYLETTKPPMIIASRCKRLSNFSLGLCL